jgi:arginine decarboxylase-like protein
MGRITAVVLLIFFAGAFAVSQQTRQAPPASGSQGEALRAIDESSANLSELAAIQAKLMQSNAESSRLCMALSKKIAEVGKMAAERGRTQEQLVQAIKQLDEMNQSFNLQYLALQENMQNESRQFTMVSNIMKTKHDTAKNSINNLR